DGDVIVGALLNFHLKSDDWNACGEFHPSGVGFAEVLSFTIDKINQEAHLLPKNITLGYDIRDYCDNPMLAVKWAYDFVANVSENRIAAVIGPEDSNTAMMVAGLLQVENIPLVSFAASSEELSSPIYRSFFRTIPPDHNQAKSIVDIIEYFNWSYVAAAAVDHSYGRYGMRALEKEAEERKTFCLAFTEYFTRTGYKNKVYDIVLRLKNNPNIKVVVLWSTEEPARRFLQEAIRQNLEGRTFLISESLATNEQEFFHKFSTVIDGCLGTVPYYRNNPDFDAHIKAATPTNTVGNSYGGAWWKEFWENEFNCSYDLKTCRKHENDTMSGQTLDKMFSAFSAKLIDAVRAVAYALEGAYRCPNQRDRFCANPKHVKPVQVLNQLRSVSFEGFSGKIQFDKNGDPHASSYQIINAQKVSADRMDSSYEKVFVGKWDQLGSPRLVITGTIRWNARNGNATQTPDSVCNHKCPAGTMQTATKSCCWQCLECPHTSISTTEGSPNCTMCPIKQYPNVNRTVCIDLPLENLDWTSLVSASMLALAITGLIMTITVFLTYLRFWSTPIVKASCRELTCILIFSISACYVLAMLYLLPPSEWLCMALPPLRYVGYSVCISVLFLKTARIFQAFQISTSCTRGNLGKQLLQGKYSVAAVALVNIFQGCLASMWLVIDPPTVYEDIKPQRSIFILCKPYQQTAGYAFLMTMLLYLILLAGLSTFYAYKARKIPENFNEARGIVFALYILILSWIVYYPVHFALDGWYVSVVSSASTLLSSYGLLICIFFPKIYVIFWHPERN
ncbi:predicted protein, partial [Nematostella vectensis]